MSSLFKQFKMDQKKEDEGVTIEYGANEDGTIPTFYLYHRSGSNQRYTKALDRFSAPHKRLIDLGMLDEKTSNKIMLNTFCDSLLKGWDNVYNEKNELIPFSAGNAFQLLTQLPELYNDLFEQSGKASMFRAESVEQDVKN